MTLFKTFSPLAFLEKNVENSHVVIMGELGIQLWVKTTFSFLSVFKEGKDNPIYGTTRVSGPSP